MSVALAFPFGVCDCIYVCVCVCVCGGLVEKVIEFSKGEMH